MPTNYVPDPDHVVRHCASQLCIYEGDDLLGVFPQAFELRPNEEYLSASWLEYFQGNKHDRITAVAAAMAHTRTIRRRHGFAIGNVGRIKEACSSYDMKIRVIHEPAADNPDPSYTAIRRFKSEESELLQLLATEAWAEVVQAGNYMAP